MALWPIFFIVFLSSFSSYVLIIILKDISSNTTKVYVSTCYATYCVDSVSLSGCASITFVHTRTTCGVAVVRWLFCFFNFSLIDELLTPADPNWPPANAHAYLRKSKFVDFGLTIMRSPVQPRRPSVSKGINNPTLTLVVYLKCNHNMMR